MRNKLMFLSGFGIGYLLGSKAGRQRYDQIMETVNRLKENPTFQETAGIIQAQATSAKETVSDKLQNTSWGAKVGQLLSSEDKGDQTSTRQYQTTGAGGTTSTGGTTSGSTTPSSSTTSTGSTTPSTSGSSTARTSTSGSSSGSSSTF